MKKEIKDQFVPYDMAKAMLMLDYDAICFAYYRNSETLNLFDQRSIIGANQDIIKVSYIKAALWQQAFDWFREKYNLYASFNIYNDKWLCIIKSTVSNEQHISGYVVDSINNGYPTFMTYPEVQFGALKKLIEIVEQKQR
jgi:hypothetical protein